MASSKKFTISLMIEAIDKVTAPIGALTRKVEKAAAEISNAMEKANRKMSQGSSGGGRRGKGGSGKGASGGFAAFAGLGGGGGAAGLAAMVPPQIAALSGLASGAVAGFRYFTAASDAAAESSTRFYAVMKASGKYTKSQTEALKRSSDAIQDRTAIEDDAFAPGFASIANTVKSTSAAEKLKMTLADLMTAQEGLNTTQEGGLTAAAVISKAFNGNAGSLKRMGVAVTKTQEQVLKLGTAEQKAALISKLIGKKYGGLSVAEAATPKGRERQIANQWNNVSESIGAAFNPLRRKIGGIIAGFMPTLQKAADKFPAVFDKAVNALQKTFGPGVTAMIGHIRAAFAGINFSTVSKGFQGWATPLKLLNPILDLLGKIIGTVGAAVVKMYANSQPALQRIAKAFEPIISALSRLWDKVLGPFVGWLLETVVPFILDGLAPVFEMLGKVIGTAIDWIADAIVAVAKWVSDTWPKIKGFFSNLWNNITTSIAGFKNRLMDAWKAIWNPVFEWISSQWEIITAPFKAIYGFFTGATADGGGVPKQPKALGGSVPQANPHAPAIIKWNNGLPSVSGARVELVIPGSVKARVLHNNGVDLTLGYMGGVA